MAIKLAEIKDLKSINEYVNNNNISNLYHDVRWGKIIEKSFRHKYHVLLSVNTRGIINGILPLVHMKSFSFGKFLVSMPYVNYGGVCAEDETTQNLLIAEAIRIANNLKVSHIEFRQEKILNGNFQIKTSKVSMRLNLPDSPDELWKSFPSKLRSQIKVPQKAGMVARVGQIKELKSFYEVFSTNMRDLGTPVYPKYFFMSILEEFPESTWICSVYIGDVPVASGFLVGFKKRLEIPWASSIRNYNRLSPNMLLYWSCLKLACEKGFAMFDFGRSTKGESTHKFKEQWGAVPTQMIWSYWVRNGRAIPDITPHNRKYHAAIGIWKKLPMPITKILGPRIIRNIP